MTVQVLPATHTVFPSTCLSGAVLHVSGWAPDSRFSVSRSGLPPTAVSSTVPFRPSEAPLTFKPGDKVVYPHHGAAIVEKKEKRKAFGESTEYLVLRMTDGDMTLSVPVDKVEDVGMRWPISKEDVEDLFEVLQKRDIREPANWSRRFKNHQEKLKSGDVYQVAEVVRNLALRDQAKGLSAGEKTLYNKALDVLVSELAFALNTPEEKASAKVADALS